MSITLTNLPKDDILSFFKEVANQKQKPIDETNFQKELIHDFATIHKKYPGLVEYSPAELMHVYGLEDLIKRKAKTNYLLDEELMQHTEHLQFYMRVDPISVSDNEVGVILGYHPKHVEQEKLNDSLEYLFITTEGKEHVITEHDLFLPLLVHQDLYYQFSKVHAGLELANLKSDTPKPIGVLSRLGKRIVVETHYRVPGEFYVNQSGELDARSIEEGKSFLSANKKLSLYLPNDPNEPYRYLPAHLEKEHYLAGDRYVVSRKDGTTHDVERVSIKCVNGIYTQTIKNRLGVTLTSSALIGGKIHAKYRGFFWRYLHGDIGVIPRDEHINQCLMLQNYLVVEEATTHEHALTLLLTGKCDHIQPDEAMRKWLAIRFGDQQKLSSEIQTQIQTLKGSTDV